MVAHVGSLLFASKSLPLRSKGKWYAYLEWEDIEIRKLIMYWLYNGYNIQFLVEISSEQILFLKVPKNRAKLTGLQKKFH